MKINKIFKFLLGIDFFLLVLSVIFMKTFNLLPIHKILGVILLVLGAIHIVFPLLIRMNKK
jgi:hypothetical protein